MTEKKRTWPTLNTYIEGNTVKNLDSFSVNDYEYETSPRRAEEIPVRKSAGYAAQPARKPSPSERPAKRRARRPAEEPKVYREPKERTSRMTPVFAAFTTAALAVLLFFAFRMLAAQTALAAASENVTALESELKTAREENNKLEALVDANADLEHIYQVATEELGLVSSDQSQVIYYDQIESGYVRQYEIIP